MGNQFNSNGHHSTARAERLLDRRQRVALRGKPMSRTEINSVRARPLLALPAPPAVTHITPRPKRVRRARPVKQRRFPRWVWAIRVGFQNPPNAGRRVRQLDCFYHS